MERPFASQPETGGAGASRLHFCKSGVADINRSRLLAFPRLFLRRTGKCITSMFRVTAACHGRQAGPRLLPTYAVRVVGPAAVMVCPEPGWRSVPPVAAPSYEPLPGAGHPVLHLKTVRAPRSGGWTCSPWSGRNRQKEQAMTL